MVANGVPLKDAVNHDCISVLLMLIMFLTVIFVGRQAGRRAGREGGREGHHFTSLKYIDDNQQRMISPWCRTNWTTSDVTVTVRHL